MNRKFQSTVIAAVCTFALSAAAFVSSETETAASGLGASMVSETKFDAGQSALTDGQKKDIASFVQEAKQKGKIKEIKVLAWSDQEYPVAEQKLSKAEIDKAKNRAQEIRKYLKNELKVSSVDSYNMAERPNGLEKLFKTGDAKVKNTMESGGAAPTTSDGTGLFGLKAQASKAVIMVYMN